MGNMFAFTGSDIYGRFKRLQGYDVFEPIGLRRLRHPLRELRDQGRDQPGRADPAEHRELPPPAQAHRRDGRLAARALDHRSGATTSGRSGSSCSSQGGAWPTRSGRRSTGARTTRPCWPTSRSINGACERCGTPVEQRFLEQWFFRITDYAERLLAEPGRPARWTGPRRTTTAQRNWIGRSEGPSWFAVRWRRCSRRRRDAASDPGVHHPARHGLRRDVHGAGAGASAGRRAHRADEQRRGRGVPQGARRARTSCRGSGRQGEDRRLHRRLRASTRRPASRSRSGSPTTC